MNDEIYMTSLIRRSMPQFLLDQMAETAQLDTEVRFRKGREAVEALRIFDQMQRVMFDDPCVLVKQGRYVHFEIAEYLTYKPSDVYIWMSKEYGGSRWSARSIRRYCECARFYTEAETERFRVLPFSHFEFAKKYGRPFAIEILAISIRQMDNNNGRPPSVDWLEFNCGELGYEIAEIETNEPDLLGDEQKSSYTGKTMLKRYDRVSGFLRKQAQKFVKDDNQRILVESLIDRIMVILRNSVKETEEESSEETEKAQDSIRA